MAEPTLRLSPVISTTSVKLLDANELRKWAIIQNHSSNTVYIQFGIPATATSGIKIIANGDYEINSLNMSTDEIHAIASGASTQLGIVEVSHGIA